VKKSLKKGILVLSSEEIYGTVKPILAEEKIKKCYEEKTAQP